MNKRFSSLIIVAVFVFVLSTTANAEIFFAYLEGRQEVPPAATSATGYARVFVDESTMMLSFTVVFNNLSSAQTASHIHAPAPLGANAPVAINFGVVGGTSGTITGTAAITAAQLTQLRQHQGYVNVHTSNFPGGEIRGQLGPKRPVDFDGDGRQDYSVLRFPATGTPRPINYWNLNSTGGAVVSPVWGDALRDFPAPGDWDGDGLDDYSFYRAGATVGAQSEFWILKSSDSTVQYYAWGVNGDLTIARDYDGDGITDAAVFRRGTSTSLPAVWYIRRSSDNTAQVVSWGRGGATTATVIESPVPGDYDGDGKFDVAIYRWGSSPNNTFIILRSSDGATAYQPWGNFQSDYILPGDYDGDGRWDFAAGRTGATSTAPIVWWIRHADGTQRVQTFGLSSDLPVQGDYDGDARTDIAVYRAGATGAPSNFWVLGSFDNTARVTQWGVGGDFATATFDAR